MNLDELQHNLSRDRETLKHLKVGIIPAKKYYLEILGIWTFIYVLFVSIHSLGCFIGSQIGFLDTVENYKLKQQENYQKEINTLVQKIQSSTSLVEVEMFKAYQKKIQQELIKLNEEIETAEHFDNLYMLFGIFLTPGIFFLFFFGMIQMYVIFKNQFQNYLLTGNYINKKIQQAFKFFITLYSIILILGSIPLHNSAAFIPALFAFFISFFVTLCAVNSESSRIGITIVTDAISDFFKKNKHLEGAPSHNGSMT